MKVTGLAVSAAVCAAAVVVGATAGPAGGGQGVRPCASEDSPGPCLWNAQQRGNGLGRSFFRDAQGRVCYLRQREEA